MYSNIWFTVSVSGFTTLVAIPCVFYWDVLAATKESLIGPDALIGIIRALAWPIVVLAGFLFFRKALSTFLEGLGERVTKFSLLKIELELSKLPEAHVLALPSIEEFLEPTPTANPSSGPSMLNEVLSTEPSDYVIVNLGRSQKWLTSRLFIFAEMLNRVRGLRCMVFLHEEAGTERLFLGMAAPDKVRWALGRKYPWLEYTYSNQYRAELSNPVQPYEQPRTIPNTWSLPLESVETGERSLVDLYELAAQRKKRAESHKPVKPNLTNLRPGQILSYQTGDLRTAEARHTKGH